jgi:hypothetical protein
MKTKQCEREGCNEEFTPKRSTGRFCSDTCRTQNWLENNKVESRQDATSPPPLKEVTSVANNKIDNPIDEDVNTEMSMLEVERYMQLQFLGKWEEKCEYAVTALIKPNQYRVSIDKLMFGKDKLGTLNNKPYEGYLKSLNMVDKQLFLTTPINRLNPLFIKKFQSELYDQQKKANKAIKQINEHENVLAPIAKRTSGTAVDKNTNCDIKRSDLSFINSKVAKQNNSKIEEEPDGKIIASPKLNQMRHTTILFDGKWKEFLGQPPIDFNCIIHGMPGEGKSTFAIQFAHYLAVNFGKVLYVSGEEGWNKTLKDKFQKVNAITPDLHIADIRKYEEITMEVKTNTYNFIFVDSLDTMGIDSKKLKALRNHYKNVAIISICQSTKDGKMRGSNEIVHDTDIAIRVEKGIAETTKNRLINTNQKFDVFAVFDSQD